MSAKRILICVAGRVVRFILHWYIKKFIHRAISIGDIVIGSWIAPDNLMVVLAGLHLIGIVSEEGLYGITFDVDGGVVD